MTEGIGCVQPIGGSAVILDIYVELLQEDIVFLLMFRHYMAVPKIYLALKLIVKHLLIAATRHSSLIKAIYLIHFFENIIVIQIVTVLK